MTDQYDLRRFLPSNNKNAKPSPAAETQAPILGTPTSPSIKSVMPSAPEIEQETEEQDSGNATIEQSTAEQTPQMQTNRKDDYVAKLMHELVLNSGWVSTRTTPESNYYFYTYLPPAHKRMWMQARVYISKSNLGRIITIEGLTIPAGVQDRLTIVIRTQKSGGVGQLANSKTVTQTLDTNNYFNQNSQLVNPDGLRAVLSSYLKQAEIL